jgi:CPA2 family monovalent cation:H+ antiporter-2
MVGYADLLAEKLGAWMFKRPSSTSAKHDAPECKKALIIGFGPAGIKVAEILKEMGVAPEIIELNPSALESAERQGVVMHLGDATKTDVLQHAGIHDAAVVVVTVPDSRTAASMIRTIRSLMPEVPIIGRGRYHRHISLLEAAGASLVVDEEQLVGGRLADSTVSRLSETGIHAMVCRIVGKDPQSVPQSPGASVAKAHSAEAGRVA